MVRKTIVLLIILVLVLPLFIYKNLGRVFYFIGRAIEDSFTYGVDPFRLFLYRWAWKRKPLAEAEKEEILRKLRASEMQG